MSNIKPSCCSVEEEESCPRHPLLHPQQRQVSHPNLDTILTLILILTPRRCRCPPCRPGPSTGRAPGSCCTGPGPGLTPSSSHAATPVVTPGSVTPVLTPGLEMLELTPGSVTRVVTTGSVTRGLVTLLGCKVPCWLAAARAAVTVSAATRTAPTPGSGCTASSSCGTSSPPAC